MKNRIKRLRIELIALVISIVALIHTILRSQGLSMCTINEDFITSILRMGMLTAIVVLMFGFVIFLLCLIFQTIKGK